MIKRRKILLNGVWQLDGRNQVYELNPCTTPPTIYQDITPSQ